MLINAYVNDLYHERLNQGNNSRLSLYNYDIARHVATQFVLSAEDDRINLRRSGRLIRTTLGQYGTLRRNMAGDIAIVLTVF